MKTETISVSENKPWVDEFLIPHGACKSAIQIANKFDDPQQAWLEWEKPGELLWTLVKAGVDRRKVLACLMEIVERVVPVYEKKFPNDTRVRNAVKAVRRCSEEDSKENRDAAAAAARAAAAAARAADAAILASYATYARAYVVAARAADAASCAAHTAADIDAASYAAHTAASYAVDAVSYAAVAMAADAASCDDACIGYVANSAALSTTFAAWTVEARESEREWQLKCIRRHFPVRPSTLGKLLKSSPY